MPKPQRQASFDSSTVHQQCLDESEPLEWVYIYKDIIDALTLIIHEHFDAYTIKFIEISLHSRYWAVRFKLEFEKLLGISCIPQWWLFGSKDNPNAVLSPEEEKISNAKSQLCIKLIDKHKMGYIDPSTVRIYLPGEESEQRSSGLEADELY